MKLMRLAVCAAVFALTCGIVLSEDVASLQAKLAAQEARLNDLQAKMYSNGGAACDAPEAITSLRKNATVTVGGFFNTRYYYKKSELQSSLITNGTTTTNTAGGPRRVVSKGNVGDLTIGDTAIQFKVDVNEYFDAFVQLNFNDTLRPYGAETGIAQNYWMRWKNVCNTGFGLLVGRDSLKFGGIQSYGFFDSYGNGWDDATGSAFAGWGGLENSADSELGEGMFMSESSIVPTHTIWNNSRTIQVTPYWESQDGKLKAELSWFQMTENAHANYTDASGRMRSINYGWGSFSTRLTWKPIEGLTVMGSFINQHADNPFGRKFGNHRNIGNGVNGDPTIAFSKETSNNNFASNLGVEYRPCFFNRLNVFASWTHGWNEDSPGIAA
ncbi:MAG: hypothetical protein LBS30_00860 [Planctomycetota bacterium]|jgi:hypothetical protein|nr:hypothetical protein [Planctomycetota bacterium]